MDKWRKDLILKDSIRVLTQNGESSIQFYLGDICMLKAENKVDILLVSAFGENYNTVQGTLIGALHSQLKVSVGKLAKKKAEDLRDHYSCWVTHPLPKHLPFRKILCFEPTWLRTVHPKELVGDVFRCLVPILQEEGGTVITPILSTGKVGFPETDLFESLVQAAVNWMKAGLPLKVLKIVQYATFTAAGEVDGTVRRDYEGVSKLFGELKERYDMQYLIPKETPVEYDVYLSCSEADKEISDKLQEELKKAKPDIKIVIGSDQKMIEGECWQDDMYNTMMKSARVITILSPQYLESPACIEQYNIALCCNRKAHKDLLAPFYIQTCNPELPSYMQLVQYVDCLPNDVPKMCEGVLELVRSLSHRGANLYSDVHTVDIDPVKYDVFLSYSHTNNAEANQIVSCLQKTNPELNIFFDIQELKQGKAWQRLLYHSIDGTTVFIALISDRYLQSAVCNEEYSLALAKFLTKGDPLQLILVTIEDIKSLPAEYQCVTLVDGVTDLAKQTEALCEDLNEFLKNPSEKMELEKTKARNLVVKGQYLNLDEEFSSLRRMSFKQRFPLHDSVMTNSQLIIDIPSKSNKCDIALSYHKMDQKYADYFVLELERLVPDLAVEHEWANNKSRLATMESALRIVTLVSPNYLESPEQVEEFHIAVWRQRMADPSSPILYPIQIHRLPVRPSYFHIVPYVVSLEDRFWLELAKKVPTLSFPAIFSKKYDSRFKKEKHLALDIAISDLAYTAVKHRKFMEGKPAKPHASLANISTAVDQNKPVDSAIKRVDQLSI